MHLNESDIAKAAEALLQGKYAQLDSAIKEHLSSCDQCAMEVQSTSDILEDVKLGKRSNDGRRRLPILRLVSGVAAASLVAVGLWQLLGPEDGSTPVLVEYVQNQDSVDTSPKDNSEVVQLSEVATTSDGEEEIAVQEAVQNQNLLAYQSYEELEKLVARFEEGALRGEQIEILVPTTIEGVVGETVIFWKNPACVELLVEFFNNSGEKLFEVTSSSRDQLNPELKRPGLYYYKVLNEDFDLVFCGRIKVLNNASAHE